MENIQKFNIPQWAKVVALGLTFAAYFFVPYQMISKSEKVLTDGTVFRFRPRPVDPGDIFRGKYVQLDFANTGIPFKDASESFSQGQTVYATIANDSAGYAFFNALFTTQPEHTADYIKTTIDGVSYETVWVQVPFSKYYLNENIAREAENTARELMRDRDTVRVYMDVRVKNGESAIEELYFDGVPVVEYLQGR